MRYTASRTSALISAIASPTVRHQRTLQDHIPHHAMCLLHQLSLLPRISKRSITNSRSMHRFVNPLIPTLKSHGHGPLYSNTVIGTVAVDGYGLLHSVQRGGAWGSCGRAQSPPRCIPNVTAHQRPCTNFDVALWLPLNSKWLLLLLLLLKK